MTPTQNPLLTPSALPYGLPPFAAITSEHFAPAFEAALAEHTTEIRAIADSAEPPSFANTIEALEQAGQALSRVSACFFGLVGAHTNPVLQAVQTDMAPRLSAHYDALLMDAALFGRIDALHIQRSTLSLSAEEERLLDRYRTQFVRAGANLDEQGKARLKAINSRLSTLTTEFQQRLLADTNARALHLQNEDDLAGLSDDERAAARAAAEERDLAGWVITLVLPTGQPALASLESRSVRQRLYDASVGRGVGEDGTVALVPEIVRLRAERATLLGYRTHADYVLADRTAGSAKNVHEMLDRIIPAAASNARREAEAIAERMAADGINGPVEPWDWPYYAEKVRQAEFSFDVAAMKPYLSMEQVLTDGVFHAAECLYGLTFTERTDLAAYHEDVRIYEVFRDGDGLGLFVFDPYARPSKRGGAWMSSYVSQAALTGHRPVAANHLNIPKPAKGSPALLTFEEVTTLFHEFGHALHGLLSDVRHPYFSGLSVPWDFVEFPSQFNEFWSTWPEFLRRYARHHTTGEPMPTELVEKFLATRTFNEGFATTEYLAAATVDLAWHELTLDEVPDDVMAFEAEALRRAGLDLPMVPPRYSSPYFAHVFAGGYAAGYYSYIWAEVLDADAARWFEENGGPTRDNGERLRAAVLSRGGSEDAMTMYRNFRGAEPTIEPLLERRALLPAA